jgi:hypothetical protein
MKHRRSLTLEALIRETIREIEARDRALYLSPHNAWNLIPEAVKLPPAPTGEKQDKSKALIKDILPDLPKPFRMYAGALGSFSPGGAPDYYAVADNTRDAIVIRKHSKSPYLNNDSIYKSRLSAKPLLVDDPIALTLSTVAKVIPDNQELDDDGFRVLEDPVAAGWYIVEKDKNSFIEDYSDFSQDNSLVMQDYFVIPRKDEFFNKDHAPKREYTDVYKQRLMNFECDLSVDEVISGFIKYKATDKEYTKIAACFKSYADSLSGQLLVGLITGVIASIFTTPIGGVVAGLTAMGVHDILFRTFVAQWAYANNYKQFFYANVVYICINLIFLSMSAFKLFKGYKAAKAAAVAAEKTAPLAALIPNTPLPPTASSTWRSILSFLAEFIISIWSWWNAGEKFEIDQAQIINYLEDTSRLDTELQSSMEKLMREARVAYPSR